MCLLLKKLLFTAVVPGTVAVYLPLQIAGDTTVASGITLAVAVILFAIGGAIYISTVWDFAAFGMGTPAPIDAPRRSLGTRTGGVGVEPGSGPQRRPVPVDHNAS